VPDAMGKVAVRGYSVTVVISAVILSVFVVLLCSYIYCEFTCVPEFKSSVQFREVSTFSVFEGMVKKSRELWLFNFVDVH